MYGYYETDKRNIRERLEIPDRINLYCEAGEKGFLRMNQSGRNATYEIIIPELSYQQEQSRKFVKFWNRGSVAQFLTAFYKDHKLTKEEIEELRKSIDELDQ